MCKYFSSEDGVRRRWSTYRGPVGGYNGLALLVLQFRSSPNSPPSLSTVISRLMMYGRYETKVGLERA